MHVKANGFSIGTTFFATLPLLLLLFTSEAAAQKPSAVIKGSLAGADGKPMAYTAVKLKRLLRETVTDNTGFFQFNKLPAAADTLLVASLESDDPLLAVRLGEGEVLNVGTLKTAYAVHELENVEIKGRRSRSYKSDYSFFGSKTETPSLYIPQSIASVTKELIQDKMAFTLKDIAGEVAGVNSFSGYDEYTIRGFRAENARCINGLRGYNAIYASPLLVNVERIEVIKGPTATLYGNCDPGGTINLVTKKPLDTKEAVLNVYAGSRDHYRIEGDVTSALNKKKTWLYRLNAGYDAATSFRNRVRSGAYQVAPTLSFIPDQRLKLNFDFSLSRTRTVLDRGQPGYRQDATLRSTPIELSLVQPGDYLHETDIASALSLSYKLSDRLSFNSGYLNYLVRQDVADHGLNAYLSPDSVSLYYTRWHYPATTHTLTTYFTYKKDGHTVSHTFLLGYDFIKSSVRLDQQYYELPNQFGQGSGIVGTFSLKNPVYAPRPTDAYRPANYNKDNTDVDGDVYRTSGVYLQDQVSIKKWKFLFSLREELYAGGGEDDSAAGLEEKVFLPRIGITYAVKPSISLYATYNKGFDPFEASIATQVFDAPFKPITSQLLEAGAKAYFFHSRLAASLAVYQLMLQNVAVNANDIGNPNLFVQQGENRSRGVEAEASGSLLPNLRVYLAYAYNKCKVTKSKTPSQVGRTAENAPRHSSGSYLNYTFPEGVLKHFGVSAGHSSVSQRNTLDASVTLPGYVIFNAGLHYQGGHFKVAVLFDNLTDKRYWTGAYNSVYKWPGQPANFMANLSYRL